MSKATHCFWYTLVSTKSWMVENTSCENFLGHILAEKLKWSEDACHDWSCHVTGCIPDQSAKDSSLSLSCKHCVHNYVLCFHVAVHAFCCATLCKLATFPSGSLVSHGLSCSIHGQFTSSSHLSKRAFQKVVSSLVALIRMKRQLWSQTRDASDMCDSSFVRCTHSAELSVTPCRCTVQMRLVTSSRLDSD